MKNTILTAAAALFLSTSAMAQTATPAAPADAAAPATTAPAAGSDTGGMMMGTTANVDLQFVTISEADIMASRLDDLHVYNNENERIGEIKDLAIQDGKTISGVVVSVGGFLGIGERYVLLKPSSIVLADQKGTLRALVNTSKDELTNAPAFSYEDGD
ncbi:PRC-barrel domain-containing protein [Antarcticirhabdus aurantiaca]|uniref:PRC-barrel domain-containing protein n=2 Tax=Antarcticirhabdus aurantiaca TaxID=2606717 RepID=A0ACD4NVJ9_9HYPH|nr:PRC-barrel domain-containing protein [Jeongeuplla avenae]